MQNNNDAVTGATTTSAMSSQPAPRATDVHPDTARHATTPTGPTGLRADDTTATVTELAKPAKQRPAANPAPRRQRALRPARLTGSITTPNRSSRNRPANVTVAPSRANSAALRAGEHLAVLLLSNGVPVYLDEQYLAFEAAIAEVLPAYAGDLERRSVAFLETCARHLIHHTQPTHLRFLDAAYLTAWFLDRRDARAVAALNHTTDATTSYADEARFEDDVASELFARARVMWMHEWGPAAGIVVDRFHHTERAGVLAIDTWARRKVAEDLTAVNDYLCAADPDTDHNGTHPGVRGVRVITPRVPNGGLHFVCDPHAATATVASHHTIGGCTDCDVTRQLPAGSTRPDGAAGPADANLTATDLATLLAIQALTGHDNSTNQSRQSRQSRQSGQSVAVNEVAK